MNFLSVFNGFWWTLAEFLMNFGLLCKHFGIVTQCSVDPSVPVLLTAKPLRNLIFGRHLRKIGICFGNRPIADFFHDQTIFLKDCELYTIGHSLTCWYWKSRAKFKRIVSTKPSCKFDQYMALLWPLWPLDLNWWLFPLN